ncbi:MAG: VIT1/CCC1 transporter family protein [Alphaproteobacteria bacterium]|nr:VIT1/CCC1 transporter family protein [Alphaproteobacteria bacterium]
MAKKILSEERLKYTGAMVLGMHDALVELTGIIAGLTFALANNSMIILTGVIAAVASSLSMAAANYLAQKADGNPCAITAGIYTGMAYLVTAALLLVPFMIFSNRFYALGTTFAVAVLIIFLFNYCISCAKNQKFIRPFLEMIIICFSVSIIAFIIGQAAKYFLGIG